MLRFQLEYYLEKILEMDKYALKIIVGHKIEGITGPYTTRDIEWRRKDIEKISYNVLV